MTYSESAKGQTITRERAVVELKRRGITASEDINQFFRDMGTATEYDAHAVLLWLGY